MLDAEAVASLRRLDRDGQLGPRLREALARTVQRLQPDWQTADRERLRRAAHTLRAAALQLGARELASRCAELEAAATQADEPTLTALMQPLPEALQALQQALQLELQ